MSILLPVAGLSLSLVLLLIVGALVGWLSGLFGVGGGFLITPVLMMIGVPPTVAAASGSCQMVATSSSGMAAHSRQGNVDMKMGGILLVGGLAGAELGVRAIEYLHTLGEASLAIELSYVLVLGSLGSYMFFQSLKTLRRGALAERHHQPPRGEGRLSWLPWQIEFPRSGVRHSILVPMFLALIVGILASIMGVGGGFIMLPMMVYLLGMPTHIAVGTSLFQILFLCAGVTYLQAAANQTVDLVLVLPLALGSALGAQLGARLSRLMRGEQLMILLAVIVLAVTGEMVSKLILHPASYLRPPSIMHERGTIVPGKGFRRTELRSPPGLSPPMTRLAYLLSGDPLRTEWPGLFPASEPPARTAGQPGASSPRAGAPAETATARSFVSVPEPRQQGVFGRELATFSGGRLPPGAPWRAVWRETAMPASQARLESPIRRSPHHARAGGKDVDPGVSLVTTAMYEERHRACRFSYL